MKIFQKLLQNFIKKAKDREKIVPDRQLSLFSVKKG